MCKGNRKVSASLQRIDTLSSYNKNSPSYYFERASPKKWILIRTFQIPVSFQEGTVLTSRERKNQWTLANWIRFVDRPFEAAELATSNIKVGRWMSSGMLWWWRIQAAFSSAFLRPTAHRRTGQGHTPEDNTLDIALSALELD